MSFKGKITLFKRWIRIVFGKNRVAVKQGIGKHYSKIEISGYYNDLTGKVNKETLLDADGIPVNIIENNKTVYFPISIFQFALGLYDLYIVNKDIETLEHFKRILKWIIDNQQVDGSWNCFEPIGYKSIKYSSMGQGEAISVLMRGYDAFNDKSCLDCAKKAVAFMCKDIHDGGTLRLENDYVFFEEYANCQGEKLTVLNGWIFTIFGLFDYLLIVDDCEVKELYNKTIMTLSHNLARYDRKYWSNYDLTGRICSPAYHDLHICLLRVLYDLTGFDIFNRFASRWKKQQHNIFFRFFAILVKFFQKLGDSPEGILVK